MRRPLGIALAFVGPWLSAVMYTGVAVTSLVPDGRVERYLASRESTAA